MQIECDKLRSVLELKADNAVTATSPPDNKSSDELGGHDKISPVSVVVELEGVVRCERPKDAAETHHRYEFVLQTAQDGGQFAKNSVGLAVVPQMCTLREKDER